MNQSASKCRDCHYWLSFAGYPCEKHRLSGKSIANYLAEQHRLAPAAAPCEHKYLACGSSDCPCKQAKPLAQGRWRPTFTPPRMQGKYKRRTDNGTDLHPQYWTGVEWCRPADMEPCYHQHGEYFDPGSKGDEQWSAGSESNAATSARCTDAEAVAGGAARHAGSIPAHSAHQELAALRAEFRRKYGAVRGKFGL